MIIIVVVLPLEDINIFPGMFLPAVAARKVPEESLAIDLQSVVSADVCVHVFPP